MIEDTLAKIESAAKQVAAADPRRRDELLRLLAALKEELRGLDASHDERAASVADFAEAAAREATRRAPAPGLRKLSLDALAESVRGFESSHPAIARTVDAICRELAGLGI